MENENKPVNWDNHEDSQAEEFRRQLLNEAERNRLLMKTIQDLQKQVYDGYQRIKELTDEKKHELEVISVFQKIDNLNHITNPNWFLFLNKFRLVRFYRELIDIWRYRLQIEGQVKRNIIPPHGKPFPNNINFDTTIDTVVD